MAEAGTRRGPPLNHMRWPGGGLLTVAVAPTARRSSRCCSIRLRPQRARFRRRRRLGRLLARLSAVARAALGKLEMAETLLKRGADPNVHVDSSGSSVYSAYSHKQWQMVYLLRRHGGIVTADIAAIYRQTDIARQMLDERCAGTAEVRSLRRRHGNRTPGAGTNRLAARRPALVPLPDRATRFLASHSLALCGKQGVRSRRLPLLLPAHSGALRRQRGWRLRADRPPRGCRHGRLDH